ncbi:SDR family NAD(P)-dependent oxidoreductase [Actinomadura fulvescens]|uniref:SDR family NAD(P)-dependent oxidoreductase n=1 Tax=Actinomadura fulvescens TaxID=46160 RepID=UPI0031DB205B
MIDADVSLAGRVAVVTGAGAGLGRAEALALAAAGARVVVNDLHAGAARAVAAEIGAAGGEAVAHPGDVADWATGEGLLTTALTAYGSLDVVVNNAGFTRDRMLFNLSEEEWDAAAPTRSRWTMWRRWSPTSPHPPPSRSPAGCSSCTAAGSRSWRRPRWRIA